MAAAPFQSKMLYFIAKFMKAFQIEEISRKTPSAPFATSLNQCMLERSKFPSESLCYTHSTLVFIHTGVFKIWNIKSLPQVYVVESPVKSGMGIAESSIVRYEVIISKCNPTSQQNPTTLKYLILKK